MSALHSPALKGLIAAYHARTPPRTWSLLVTIFGDVLLGRDDALSAADLGGWLAAFDIEPGLVRTALSRLVADGTLIRTRIGRGAHYRLSPESGAEFRAAADMIYGRAPPEPTGRVVLTVIEHCPDRTKARTMLIADGARLIGSTLLVRPEHAGRALLRPEGALVFLAQPDDALHEKASMLWPLEALDTAYHAVIESAGALCAEVTQMEPREAFLARIMLVHAFRRVVLRDPFLPPALLPLGWSGGMARTQFDIAYAALKCYEKN